MNSKNYFLGIVIKTTRDVMVGSLVDTINKKKSMLIGDLII